MEPKVERITKLDAARRQLLTAIELFFQRGDSVSIHTLAAAADGILLAITKKTHPDVALKNPHNPENPIINPEKRQEWIDVLHGPRNFFKHGSRDANKTFDFRPESTAFHILNCVMLYQALSKTQEPEISVFST